MGSSISDVKDDGVEIRDGAGRSGERKQFDVFRGNNGPYDEEDIEIVQ